MTLHDSPSTIAGYLTDRLRQQGVDHIFGVPGDYIINYFDYLESTSVTTVITCDEQGAGFAADAYARIRGLGVVCVTYGVGALKIANSTAQAFAERSPVVVISGAPALSQRSGDRLLHHVINGFDNQRRVFEQLTVATAVLDDPSIACREIDRVIDAALTHKRPVYIEIPRDMILAPVQPSAPAVVSVTPPNDATLAAAVADAVVTLRAAAQPVAIVGLEAVRFGLLPVTRQLIEQRSFPTVVTPLSKSAISEQHPCFVGVYGGAMSRQPVREFVESADCLLMIGAPLTDLDFSGVSVGLSVDRMIFASPTFVRIAHRTYEGVRLADFLAALVKANLPDFSSVAKPAPVDAATSWVPNPATDITVARLFERLGAFLTPDTVVIADPGDAMFGALDLPVHQDHEFLANAFYASLGFAVPASIGAQLAAPSRRPLVLVGDGAFQMTGVELSTALRYGLNPVVLVLNNGGYLTERLLAEGPFNDILSWRYAALTELFGAGRSVAVGDEEQLDAALIDAATSDELFLIEVKLSQDDASPALRRLAEGINAAAGVGAGHTA